ncbi:MAG: sulfatase [Planctomycetota bacterium]|jgi:arylsulfatase A-like enzyme
MAKTIARIPVALFVLALLGAQAQGANRYNVLFIAVDDLRPELGCYGAGYAQSPHLDSFASGAVVFTHHYVQVPTCGASRAALLTGRSPARSGAMGNSALYKGRSALDAGYKEKAQTLPEAFRRSGYRTACIGKISHTPDGRVFAYNGKGDGRPELPHAWDELPTPFGPWKRGWGTFFAYEGGRHREDGKGNRDLMEFRAARDTDLPDGLMADAAVAQLRKWKGQRFFIGLGFYKPHLPFVATRGDWQAFEGKPIPPPPNQRKPKSPNWHGSGEFYKYNAPFPKKRPLDPDALTRSRRAYLACVRYVDRQIGKVLAELKRLRLDENTIVVIWGDHGWFLGDMQMWGKHSAFEEALRSVLMVRVPGVASQKNAALVETVDLFPTLVDYCAVRDPATRYALDGRSLRPVLEGASASVRDAALSYWGGRTSIRTPTHRLIVGKGSPELYLMDTFFTTSPDTAAANPDIVSRLKGFLPKR